MNAGDDVMAGGGNGQGDQVDLAAAMEGAPGAGGKGDVWSAVESGDSLVGASVQMESQLEQLGNFQQHLTNQLDVMRREGVRLLEKQKLLASERSKLEGQKAELTAEWDKLKAEKAQENEEVGRLRVAVAAGETLRAEKSALENTLAEKNAAVEAVGQELEAARAAAEGVRKELEAAHLKFQKELDAATTNSRKEWEEAGEKLRGEKLTLEKALGEKNAAVESVGRELSAARAAAEAARQELEAATLRFQKEREAANATFEKELQGAKEILAKERGAFENADVKFRGELEAANLKFQKELEAVRAEKGAADAAAIKQMETERHELDRRARELEGWERGITEEEQRLLARQMQLAEGLEKLDAERRAARAGGEGKGSSEVPKADVQKEWGAKQAELEQRAAALQARGEELARQGEALEKRAGEIDGQRVALDARWTELAQREAELAGRIAAEQAAVEARAAALAQERGQWRDEKLKEQSAWEAQRAELAAQGEKLAAEKQALEKQLAAAPSAAATAGGEAELGRVRAELEARVAELESAKAALAARVTEVEQAKAQAEAQWLAQAQEAEEQQEKFKAQSAAWEAAGEKLKVEKANLEKELGEARKEFEIANLKFQKELEEARKGSPGATGKLREENAKYRTELEKLTAEVERMRGQLAAGDGGGGAAELEKQRAEFEEKRKKLEEELAQQRIIVAAEKKELERRGRELAAKLTSSFAKGMGKGSVAGVSLGDGTAEADKKKWEEQKAALEGKVRELEAARKELEAANAKIKEEREKLAQELAQRRAGGSDGSVGAERAGEGVDGGANELDTVGEGVGEGLRELMERATRGQKKRARQSAEGAAAANAGTPEEGASGERTGAQRARLVRAAGRVRTWKKKVWEENRELARQREEVARYDSYLKVKTENLEQVKRLLEKQEMIMARKLADHTAIKTVAAVGVFVIMALGITFVAVYWLVSPVYRSEAVVQLAPAAGAAVVSGPAEAGGAANGAANGPEVQRAAEAIKSVDVTAAAWQMLRSENYGLQDNREEWLGTMAGHLKVGADATTRTVSVQYTGPSSEGVAQVCNALAAAYVETTKKPAAGARPDDPQVPTASVVAKATASATPILDNRLTLGLSYTGGVLAASLLAVVVMRSLVRRQLKDIDSMAEEEDWKEAKGELAG